MSALPARAVRLAAGLSLADAARRARVTEGHLAGCERTNQFGFLLARKLAAAYGCRLEVFLPARAKGRQTQPNATETPAASRRPARAPAPPEPDPRRRPAASPAARGETPCPTPIPL